eukprot:ctg_510.g313
MGTLSRVGRGKPQSKKQRENASGCSFRNFRSPSKPLRSAEMDCTTRMTSPRSPLPDRPGPQAHQSPPVSHYHRRSPVSPCLVLNTPLRYPHPTRANDDAASGGRARALGFFLRAGVEADAATAKHAVAVIVPPSGRGERGRSRRGQAGRAVATVAGATTASLAPLLRGPISTAPASVLRAVARGGRRSGQDPPLERHFAPTAQSGEELERASRAGQPLHPEPPPQGGGHTAATGQFRRQLAGAGRGAVGSGRARRWPHRRGCMPIAPGDRGTTGAARGGGGQCAAYRRVQRTANTQRLHGHVCIPQRAVALAVGADRAATSLAAARRLAAIPAHPGQRHLRFRAARAPRAGQQRNRHPGRFAAMPVPQHRRILWLVSGRGQNLHRHGVYGCGHSGHVVPRYACEAPAGTDRASGGLADAAGAGVYPRAVRPGASRRETVQFVGEFGRRGEAGRLWPLFVADARPTGGRRGRPPRPGASACGQVCGHLPFHGARDVACQPVRRPRRRVQSRGGAGGVHHRTQPLLRRFSAQPRPSGSHHDAAGTRRTGAGRDGEDLLLRATSRQLLQHRWFQGLRRAGNDRLRSQGTAAPAISVRDAPDTPSAAVSRTRPPIGAGGDRASLDRCKAGVARLPNGNAVEHTTVQRPTVAAMAAPDDAGRPQSAGAGQPHASTPVEQQAELDETVFMQADASARQVIRSFLRLLGLF